MKSKLIADATFNLDHLRKSRKTAMDNLLTKRRETMKEIQNDTPDLFGDRKPAAGMFDVRADPGQLKTILAPFRAIVSNLDRDIDYWEKELVRLASTEENNLFSQHNKNPFIKK